MNVNTFGSYQKRFFPPFLINITSGRCFHSTTRVNLHSVRMIRDVRGVAENTGFRQQERHVVFLLQWLERGLFFLCGDTPSICLCVFSPFTPRTTIWKVVENDVAQGPPLRFEVSWQPVVAATSRRSAANTNTMSVSPPPTHTHAHTRESN